MGDFIYYDIFATKGIDYLIAIIGLIALIVFWRWLRKPGGGLPLWSSLLICLGPVISAVLPVWRA